MKTRYNAYITVGIIFSIFALTFSINTNALHQIPLVVGKTYEGFIGTNESQNFSIWLYENKTYTIEIKRGYNSSKAYISVLIRNSSDIIYPKDYKSIGLKEEYTLKILDNDTYLITVSSDRDAYYSISVCEKKKTAMIEITISGSAAWVVFIIGILIFLYPDVFRKLSEKLERGTIGEISMLPKLLIYTSSILNIVMAIIFIWERI